ncbi:MAG: hypothetical protein AAGD96_10585 [Chloroflexota bacterium]
MSEIDVAIVGSGLAALGAAWAASDLGLSPTVFSDDRNEIEFYNPSQILRVLGLGGTTKHWHGVVPFKPHEDELIHILERSYGPLDLDLQADRLFVPKLPLRSRNFFSKIEGLRILNTCVEDIMKEDDGAVLSLSDGELFRPKLIVLAAGVLGTLDLLQKANLAPNQILIGDHICGFVGMIKRDRLERILQTKLQAKKTNSGYHVPCKTSLDGRILFTFRPAKWEMKSPQKQIRGGPKFAASRKKVMFDLVRSASFGRLAEAVALKTGFGFSADTYAIHFQAECKNCHKYTHGDRLEPIFEAKEIAAHVCEQAAKIFGISALPDQEFYFGTHLFGAQALDTDKLRNTIIVDSTDQESIGGAHHSMRQMARAYTRTQHALTKMVGQS